LIKSIKNKNLKEKTLIVCDFDGTITSNDSTDEILKKFSLLDWRKIGSDYDHGKISHFEMNRRFAKSIVINRKLMSNFIKTTIKLRKGFKSFFQRCIDTNTRLVIVSGGWDVYIKVILKDFDVDFITESMDLKSLILNTNKVSVICNHLNYTGNGKWKLSNGWNKLSCKVSSPCKGKIMQILGGSRIHKVVIGNSSTDFCMIEKAGQIFSTGSLSSLCQNKHIKSVKFEQFNQLLKYI
jgi:2,3-diketo-5-methylthio-1-phosphopentane phosphatase